MPIPLRGDFDAPRLRAIARGTKDAAQTRRLLALAAVYDGARRTDAAAIGGVTLQIVRDWVIKFNAHGPDGLIARKAPGQPPKRNKAHRAALRAAIEIGPTISPQRDRHGEPPSFATLESDLRRSGNPPASHALRD